MKFRALIAAGASALVAMFAVACASTAESPEPTTAQPSAVASPAASPSAAACPTPPATPPASLHPKVERSIGIGTLTDMTIEERECVDRVTFTFSDNLPGYDAQYVQSWTECGSGAPVYTAGPAQLAITFIPANAHTDAGEPTITDRSRMPSYPSIKQAELTCDFEAHVSWVFGTEERYFTVAATENPPRVVLDVYH
jgi:hypothetical protein